MPTAGDFSAKDTFILRKRHHVKRYTGRNPHNVPEDFFLKPQIVYDEGPLYIFAKNEDARSRWIKTLKDSQCIHANLTMCLMFISARSR